MDIAVRSDRRGPARRRNGAGVFDRHWHAYSRWFLREGIRQRPTYLDCLKAIREHMPELLPLYEEICEAAGGGDLEARFLSMWCPPAYVGGCSQAIVSGHEPRADPQLRLQPEAARRHLARLALLGRRVRGDGRLPVGRARRHQRGRAGGLALFRRAHRRRRGFRHPDRAALRAGIRVQRQGSGGDPQARAGAHVLYGRAGRPRGQPRDHLRHAGPPGRSDSKPRGRTNHQHQVEWQRHADGDAFGRAREGAAARAQPRRQTPRRCSASSCGRRSTRPPMAAATARSTRRSTGRDDASAELVWPARSLAAILRGLPRRARSDDVPAEEAPA